MLEGLECAGFARTTVRSPLKVLKVTAGAVAPTSVKSTWALASVAWPHRWTFGNNKMKPFRSTKFVSSKETNLSGRREPPQAERMRLLNQSEGQDPL